MGICLSIHICMRNILCLFAMATVAMTSTAQTTATVTTRFSKGDYALYEVESSIGGAQANLNFKGEVTHEVKEANADGCLIEITTLKMDNTNAEAGDAINQITTMQKQLFNNVPILVKTDAQGKYLSIENIEEVRKNVEAKVDNLVNITLEQGGVGMDKDMLKNIFMNDLLGQKLIDQVGSGTYSHYELYGQTLFTGTMKDEVKDGYKMKTTYVVSAPKGGDSYNIKSSSVSNMSKEDIKTMIIEQVTKSMPDQAEAVKQNIDALLDAGMLKLDFSQQCNYDFFKNGWLKNGECNQKISLMGTETTNTVKWQLKDHRWK